MKHKGLSHRRRSGSRHPQRPRRRRVGIAHFIRGIMLEGLGAAVLIFLYLSMHASTESDEISRQVDQRMASQQTGVNGSATLSHSHFAHFQSTLSTGNDHHFSNDVNRPLPIGNASWATWNRPPRW